MHPFHKPVLHMSPIHVDVHSLCTNLTLEAYSLFTPAFLFVQLAVKLRLLGNKAPLRQ